MKSLQQRPVPVLDNDVLRTFVAIAETGNFSTAADAVFRTPSAVSMQIKKLEEMLDTTLFLRDARSVTLTASGETLLSYARNILSLSNEAVSRFIMPDLNGVVRLGATDDIGEQMLPGILKRFAEVYPGIMVDVTIDMSVSLIRRFEEQRLDLALINCSTRPFPTGGEVLFRQRLVWVGAKAGTAYQRHPLPISIWEDGCAWREDALAALDKAKRPYRIAYLSAYTMAQRAAVLSDLAVAPFPQAQVTDEMHVLGRADGLPELGSFEVRLLKRQDMDGPMRAVAESIRQALPERLGALAA